MATCGGGSTDTPHANVGNEMVMSQGRHPCQRGTLRPLIAKDSMGLQDEALLSGRHRLVANARVEGKEGGQTPTSKRLNKTDRRSPAPYRK